MFTVGKSIPAVRDLVIRTRSAAKAENETPFDVQENIRLNLEHHLMGKQDMLKEATSFLKPSLRKALAASNSPLRTDTAFRKDLSTCNFPDKYQLRDPSLRVIPAPLGCGTCSTPAHTLVAEEYEEEDQDEGECQPLTTEEPKPSPVPDIPQYRMRFATTREDVAFCVFKCNGCDDEFHDSKEKFLQHLMLQHNATGRAAASACAAQERRHGVARRALLASAKPNVDLPFTLQYEAVPAQEPVAPHASVARITPKNNFMRALGLRPK